MAEQNREEFLCVHEDVVNKVMAQMPPRKLFTIWQSFTRYSATQHA